jgi:hypothetical protein
MLIVVAVENNLSHVTSEQIAAYWRQLEGNRYPYVIMHESTAGRNSAGVRLRSGDKEIMVQLMNAYLTGGILEFASELIVPPCMASGAVFRDMLLRQARQFERTAFVRNEDTVHTTDSQLNNMLRFTFSGKHNGPDDLIMALLHGLFQMVVFYMHPSYAQYRGGPPRFLLAQGVYMGDLEETVKSMAKLHATFLRICSSNVERGDGSNSSNPRRA